MKTYIYVKLMKIKSLYAGFNPAKNVDPIFYEKN